MSVEAVGLSKSYGEHKALSNLSFKTERGTVLGILGPNGAGKSTLMKLITGSLVPDEGTLYFDGSESSAGGNGFRHLIGYLPENNPLYPELYVSEYLNFCAGIYRLNSPREAIVRVAAQTGLTEVLNKKIGELSKGYRQRVGIAQALIHDPEILILDEPTSGLDPAQLVEIRALIKRVSHDKTVLFSTHLMQEAESVCDRILILNRGRMVAFTTPSDLHNLNPKEKFSTGLELLQPIDQSLLEKIPGVLSVDYSGSNQWVIESDRDLRAELFKFAVENHLTLLTLKNLSASLEKNFLDLISGGNQNS